MTHGAELGSPVPCLCAEEPPVFPRVMWLLLNERNLCRVAYVLLKEHRPDLWDDEKLAMLSRFSSSTIFCHPASPPADCSWLCLWLHEAVLHFPRMTRAHPQLKWYVWCSFTGFVQSPSLLHIPSEHAINVYAAWPWKQCVSIRWIKAHCGNCKDLLEFTCLTCK